jgi:endonuclease/exonuclease/phosphatase family metal-dependent hydrolase
MKILSCNIRFSTMQNDHGVRAWKSRCQPCLKAILRENADIIALQECCNDQFHDLQAALQQDYDSFWMNSFTDERYPENAIFFRRSFGISSRGGWFLSETPQLPGSKSWGSECVRFVNYVVLHSQEGKRFRIINTHFDHASQIAREKQAALVCEEADAWNAIPQILTGDLNCDAQNEAIRILFNNSWRDTWIECHPGENAPLSFHAFEGENFKGDPGLCGNGKMDYVLVRGPIRTKNAEILRPQPGEIYPSDHFFVSADIDLL